MNNNGMNRAELNGKPLEVLVCEERIEEAWFKIHPFKISTFLLTPGRPSRNFQVFFPAIYKTQIDSFMSPSFEQF